MPEKGTDRSAGPPPRSRRGGLGRGLDSLIPAHAPPAPVTADDSGANALITAPIDQIHPNPYQPRGVVDRQKLEELAESIKLHGVMQPLIVTRARDGDGYVLIAGERRWRAARLAGLLALPAIVKEAAPQAMLELAIVENVVRADLSPLEEALAYRQLIDEFGLTQTAVAERVGRSRVSVTNLLRLLNAPDQVREVLASGQITEGHARALLGLSNGPDQLAVLELVLSRGLNVRQTEALVRRRLSGGVPTGETRDRDPEELRVEDRLRSALGTRVSFRKAASGSGGGSLTIQFFSDEQLQALYDRLVGEDLW